VRDDDTDGEAQHETLGKEASPKHKERRECSGSLIRIVGVSKIPERTKERTRQRILAYAETHYHGNCVRIEVRFRTQFCDSDASTDPVLAKDFPPPQVARNAGRGAGTHAQAPTPTVPSSALSRGPVECGLLFVEP